jgi:hypothetical protein
MAREVLSRVTVGSSQHGTEGGDATPRARDYAPRRSPGLNPQPLVLWRCPQLVLDVAGMPSGWPTAAIPLEPSPSSLEEMLGIRRASHMKWKFGRDVEEIAVGSADRTPGSSSLWVIKSAVTREEPEIWSLSTQRRDPQTNYSQWKLAVARDGTVVMTKIGDFGGKCARLAAWTSDRTGVPEIDNRTADLFTQMLELVPDVARQGVPNWVARRAQRGASMARQGGTNSLR